MRKLLFLLILGGCSTMGFSQNSEFQDCGTDEVMKKHYENFPQEKSGKILLTSNYHKLLKAESLLQH